MSVEKDARKCFCEVIRNINGRVDTFEVDKIALHPFTECKVFDIYICLVWAVGF